MELENILNRVDGNDQKKPGNRQGFNDFSIFRNSVLNNNSGFEQGWQHISQNSSFLN